MKNHFLILTCLGLSACVSANQSTRNFQAIDLPAQSANLDDTSELVSQFTNLCLSGEVDARQIIAAAKSTDRQFATQQTLKKESLVRLKKQTLPGGGEPIEETQELLSKSFEEVHLILEISQQFEHKKLTATTCTVFGKKNEYLKNCEQLGKLINRAPDQNTKYKESKAHFISWRGSVSSKQAAIKCITRPNSPTLPYEGTQLTVNINHLTEIKTVRKSNQPQSDASGR